MIGKHFNSCSCPEKTQVKSANNPSLTPPPPDTHTNILPVHAVHNAAGVLLEGGVVVFGHSLSEKADVTYVKVWGHESEADIIHCSWFWRTVPTGLMVTEALFRFVFVTLIPLWEDSFGPFPQPPCKGSS